MYVIIVNGGVYDCKLFEKLEDVEKVLMEWSNGERMEDDYEELVSVERLLNKGMCGEMMDVYCDSMVEMGDDFVSLSVVEVS